MVTFCSEMTHQTYPFVIISSGGHPKAQVFKCKLLTNWKILSWNHSNTRDNDKVNATKFQGEASKCLDDLIFKIEWWYNKMANIVLSYSKIKF